MVGEDTKRKLKRYPRFVMVGLFLATLVLLVLHVAGVTAVTVDSTTIALLGLLLIIPLIGNIRKLKVFDVEAEIDPEEVRRVKGELGGELPATAAAPMTPHFDFMTIITHDPQLGLAKLRIDLETALRDLARSRGIDDASGTKGLGALVTRLQEAQVLEPRLASGIRDILPLANRAAHGEHIRRQDALDLAHLGARVLTELGRAPGS